MLLVALLIPAARARADELPKNHPIYETAGLRGREQDEVVTAIAPTSSFVGMSFRLAKPRFEVGEAIEGVLRIENRSARLELELATPCAGELVTTVGVWRSPGDDRGLEEVVRNKQGFEPWYGVLTGPKLLVPPGGHAELRLAINVYQEAESDGRSHLWLPGVGFARPGTYRVWLRYLNFGHDGDYRASGGRDEAIKAIQDGTTTFRVPFEPLLIGPIEVQVVPSVSEARGRTVLEWEASYQRALLTRSTMPLPGEPAGPAPEDASPSAASVFLARLRGELLGEWHRGHGGEVGREERLLDLRRRAEQVAARLPDGVLKDGYRLTIARVLVALERKDEARTLLRQTASPDAQVLLEQLTRGSR